jgi:radical SAM protein with 4Fe4S-binding SPASM domain
MIKEARDWAGQVPLTQLHPRLTARQAARSACKMPWTELTILWDGKVVPCANHFEPDHAIGDLTRQSLDEIWNGPALSALRAAHVADAVDAVPVCATCPRHTLDHADFVAVDQLAQRRRTYLASDGRVRPGLS